MNFLENMEEEIRISEERHELQQRLDSMCQLLEKLQQAQFQRLSQPLPTSLNNCPPPSEDENQMAESITENLSDIAKRVNPGDIAPVPGMFSKVLIQKSVKFVTNTFAIPQNS